MPKKKKVTFNKTIKVYKYQTDIDYSKENYASNQLNKINLIYYKILDDDYIKALQILEENEYILDINRSFDSYQTALHLVFKKSTKIDPFIAARLITALIKHGASLDIEDESGKFPTEYGHLFIFKVLLLQDLFFQDIPLNCFARSLKMFESLIKDLNFISLEQVQFIIEKASSEGFPIKILPRTADSIFQAAAYHLSKSNNYLYTKESISGIVYTI